MCTQLDVSLRNSGKVEHIDYLKGFSIFTIVLMHLLDRMNAVPTQIHTLSAIGGTGVHVFFLCSGMGLYLSYLKRKTGFLQFLNKRFAKIYCPYIIVVIASCCLPWLYKGSDKVIALLSHIFLFKMFVPHYTGSFGAHFWFISTIIQMYLLFIPLCLLKDKLKNNKLFFCICLGISILWWIFCDLLDIGSIRIWGSFCLQYIWEFALGFVIADALYNGKTYRLSNAVLLTVAVIGIGLQAFMAITSKRLEVFNDIPGLFGYTALALLLSNITFIKTFCIKVSSFSYEFYLVHMGIFSALFYFFAPQSLVLQCIVAAIALIVSIAAAYLYHVVIRTYNNWKEGKTSLKQS